MAGQPRAGGWPEGTVYQARMRRPSKLDMITQEAVRVLMPPSITNGSLDSTTSTLASMSTLLSAARVCAQNCRISSPVAIPASLCLQDHEMCQSRVVSLRPPSACHDGSECSERVSRCQPPPGIAVKWLITRADGIYAEFLFTLLGHCATRAHRLAAPARRRGVQASGAGVEGD